MRPVDPRLLRRAKPVRLLLAALTALGVVDALLLVVQATLLADLISRLVTAPHSHARYATAVVGLLAAAAGRAAVSWTREVCAARMSTAVKAVLRADLLGYLVRGPARAADRARTGELAVLATRGVDALDGYFARYLPQLALATIVPIVVGARILVADPVSALIVGLTVPLIPVFMILIGLKTRDHMTRRWAALERLGGHFLEVVAGLPTLIAFGRAGGQAAVVRRAADAHRRATIRTLRIAFLSSLALELLAMLSVAMVAVGVGLRLADGGMTLRAGLLVLICAPEVYLPLRAVGARYHEAAEGLAVADRVLTETCAPQTRPGTRAPEAGAPIRFENVSVAREGRGARTLRGADFELAPGEVTAVVGPSGAGKSTLLHLLLGFDTPSSGRITVGGVDLADLDAERWRANIAWMPQNPRLTGTTVADAIRLGAPDATDAAVARAARAAGIDFPLDTALGRDGTAISGGQARRVALARAMLRDAPVVLLDEPTEHLDAETERTITTALRAWLPGRTVLLVTHRPAMLELCHTIIHLDAPAPREVPATMAAPVPSNGSAGTAAPSQYPDNVGRQRLPLRVLAAVGLGIAASLCTVGLAAASAWLIADAALRPPLLTLQVGIAAVQAFALGRATLRYAERLVGHDVTLRILADLRVRIYLGLVRRGAAGLSTEHDGDLLSNLTADIDAAQDLFLKVLLPIVSAAGSGAALILFDLFVSPVAALILAAGLLAAGVLAPALARVTARTAERRTQTARAEMTDRTVELLGALPDLVAYGAARDHAARVARADTRLAALERRGALASGIGAALVSLAAGATTAALAAAAIGRVRAGHVGGPTAAALVLAPLALFELLAALPDAARAYDRGAAAWARLRRLADAPALVPAPDRPVPLVWASGSVLEFDSVDAAWPGAGRTVLRDVSFRLRAGEQLRVTGPSGAGKSTLAYLAARELDPIGGAVRINGVDVREASPDDVRRIVAVCGQDAHLFDTTIRENLRIGRLDATDPMLWHALHVTCLDAWVRELPAGLDTPVGQLGDAVSGGERQRIALARALLSPAPVLILDEPTAHLDSATALAVAENLRRELRGRTAIWIQHAAAQARAESAAGQSGDGTLVPSSRESTRQRADGHRRRLRSDIRYCHLDDDVLYR